MAESATALYMQAEDSLPATMVKQALETVAEEIKNDPSLAMMKKTEQQKRDERDEATRTQLPTFDVMVEETKEAAESAAD
jgi:DNA recombination-dependent growth factor C